MAEEKEKSALELIAEVLLRHGVEFIVVGGQAELLHGSSRVTYDIDFCYRRTRENLVRLAEALVELKPTLRGAPPGLPFRLDAEALALGSNYTFRTALGDLDLLGYLEPFGDFEAIANRAITLSVGELELRVIHLDDLIAIKQHIGRPKDQLSLMHLLAIRKTRSESGAGE